MSVGYIRKNIELKFNTCVGRDEEQVRGLKFGPVDLPRMEKQTEFFRGEGVYLVSYYLSVFAY